MQPNIYAFIKPADERYNSSLVRPNTIHRRFGSNSTFSGMMSGGLVPFFTTLGSPIWGQWYTGRPAETNPAAIIEYLSAANNAGEGGNARQPSGSSFTLRHGAIRAPGTGRYNAVSQLLVNFDDEWVWCPAGEKIQRDFNKCWIVAAQLAHDSVFGVQANFADYQADAARSFGLHIEISTANGR